MADLEFLELTLSGDGFPHDRDRRGRRVLVTLPFDHAEERESCTYVCTRGGAHLYVRETLDQIKNALDQLNEEDRHPHGPD